jgi:hypothetical protein
MKPIEPRRKQVVVGWLPITKEFVAEFGIKVGKVRHRGIAKYLIARYIQTHQAELNPPDDVLECVAYLLRTESAINAERQVDKKQANKRKKHRRRQYEDYIASAQWKAFTKEIRAARNHRCEKCSATAQERQLHVHHLTYKRFMAELPEDVLLVCKPCHEDIHGRKFGKG